MTEVLIIGGGVIGLALARELHKKGVGKITLIERGKLGHEASYAAAGMLAPHAETEVRDDFFHLCTDSNKMYPKFAAELLDETGVDIELDQSGTLYPAFTETDAAEIRRRFESKCENDSRVEHLTASEIREIEPFISPAVREGLFFSDDWQVENRKLLEALRKYVRTREIEIRENADIKRLLIKNGKIAGAETTSEKFPAENVILATGAWTSLIEAGDSQMPAVSPVRGQMLSFQTPEQQIFQRVIYSRRGYLVPRKDGRILIGATVENAGFDKSITPGGTDLLLEYASEIAPYLLKLEVSQQWTGLRPCSADGLPILGEFPAIENLFIATAHYRNGILLAPLTARLLTDKITKDAKSNYLEIFSPRRFQKTAVTGKQ